MVDGFFVCGIDGRPWKKKSVNPSRVSHFQPDLRSRATLVLFKRTQRGERERETFDMDRGRFFPSSSSSKRTLLSHCRDLLLRWRDRVSQVSGVMFWSAANAPRSFCLSLSPPSVFLDGEGVCFHPESCCLRTVTNSVLVSLFFFPHFFLFFSRMFFNACRLPSSPLYHGQGRDQDRKRAELSLFIPQKLFLCLATTIHLFFSFFSLFPNTHTKRKNKAMRIGVPVCVCTFRDFRVRDGHLKPFPSPKKRQISNKLLEEFQN